MTAFASFKFSALWLYFIFKIRIGRCPVILYPSIRLSGGMNKSIAPDGINQYRISPVKLKLDIKYKMVMLNICSVNV